MKLYVAGPMSGLPEHNFPAFRAAARALRAVGYAAVDPSAAGALPGVPWSAYMRDDLRALLTCDGVAVLPGWETSRGARIEAGLADALGMPVRSLAAWLAA